MAVASECPPPPPPAVAGPPSPESRKDDEELLDVAEARRSLADNFAWTVPGLAVAAEAFLLSIALDASTRPAGRIVGVAAGGLIVLGALHFIEKQSYNFDLYDALIERQRKRLGRMSLHREAIESLDLPRWTQLKRRRERGWFAKHLGAVSLWRWTLRLLLLLNILIGGYVIWEAVADPGWLSTPNP
jgi:hypothetical protein